jgi:hypothetical protein
MDGGDDFRESSGAGHGRAHYRADTGAGAKPKRAESP